MDLGSTSTITLLFTVQGSEERLKSQLKSFFSGGCYSGWCVLNGGPSLFSNGIYIEFYGLGK